MAAVRSKTQLPIGSTQWIQSEREQIQIFHDQEMEDFAFSARNEVQWLNEHMAEIFNNNQLNFTEIFKTPGKLRGKTPRTAKKNPLETRAPLTEIFATDQRYNYSPAPAGNIFGKSPRTKPLVSQGSPVKAPRTQNGTKYHDSGYRSMLDDEMEVDKAPLEDNQMDSDTAAAQIQAGVIDQGMESAAAEPTEPSAQAGHTTLAEDEAPLAEAEMDIDATEGSKQQEEGANITTTLPGAFPDASVSPPENKDSEPQQQQPDKAETGRDSVLGGADNMSAASHSPSPVSTPEKPILRKSSLTFATLPAREPLTTKKSISRISNTDGRKSAALNRGSHFGRYTGGKSMGGNHQTDDEEMDLKDDEKGLPFFEDSDAEAKITKLHNKSSTQRLHEKINLLGKTAQPRPTKSIPTALASSAAYPELPKENAEVQSAAEPVENKQQKQMIFEPMENDDEDWIMPVPSQPELVRSPLFKSRSVDIMETVSGNKRDLHKANIGADAEVGSMGKTPPSKTKGGKERTQLSTGKLKSASTTALSLPDLDEADQRQANAHSSKDPPSGLTYTPAGSPSSKSHFDGHISASKSKLQSIMKSARGLFSSSARVSTQAKLETMSPNTMKLRSQKQASNLKEIFETRDAEPEAPGYPALPQPQTKVELEVPIERRRTRSSTENERKAQEGIAADIAKPTKGVGKQIDKKLPELPSQADECHAENMSLQTKEPAQKPIRQSPRRHQEPVQTRGHGFPSEEEPKPSRPGPGRPRIQKQDPQAQKAKPVRRPLKPTKEAAAKSKPQPVSIRVGTLSTLSQRVPLTNAALSSTLQDSLPPTEQKPVMAAKKASSASAHTASSSTTFKSSVSAASKPRALIAAERKKEQDEREAQRRLEQKREIERKRTEANEEAHRRDVERRQELERQRQRERSVTVEMDPKKAAQRQAIEKRRLEMGKKENRDHQQVVNEPARPLNSSATYRPDLGARVSSKTEMMQDFPRPPMGYSSSQALKAKRVFDPEEDDELARPRAPGGPSFQFQTNEAKRRRTNEEENEQPTVRPTKAPPIRQSNIRKDGPKPSVFGGNFPMAPPPASFHAKPTAAQHQPTFQHQPYAVPPPRGQGGEMAKYANGKIPFAEAPNPPPAAQSTAYRTPKTAPQQQQQQQQQQQYHPQHHQLAPPTASKSSPMFTNGEHIYLEEIETSDEDADSDEERERKAGMPDWARTPVMDQILRDQERVDADAVFGPMAPANLEEWFSKDKSRLHKLRQRTSSANWFGGDRLTEEEVRRDNAAREKMSREGGWSYGL